MPDKTKNLGLTIWNDTDYVDFEEINDNFKKLDNSSICKESGIATASYTGGLSASKNSYFDEQVIIKKAVMEYDTTDECLYFSFNI